ncbi:MAG: TIM barrel protein [Thermoguttaceae bacterium]|nr:TIM barrel protein [Thermoguttaceae bacterium]
MMNRRDFVKGSLAAGAAMGLAVSAAGQVRAAEPKAADRNVKKIGEGLRTKIAVAPQWFQGNHVEQIEQIAAYGFPAFETLGCGKWEDKESVRKRCEELGILCGAVGGGMGTINEWGPNDPAHHERFIASVKEGIANAQAIGSKRVLALSGAELKDVSREEQMQALVDAGKKVAPFLEEAGITLVWETLNVLVNHPGYFLVYSADGSELVKRTGHPNVKFLYDIYHQQISEGNLINNIKKYIGEIGHFHFADNPGRHEPGTGEINYKNVFRAIYETGYRDIVACEFGKQKPTEEVLEILAECDRW